MMIVTWATRASAKLPAGWQPVPLTLKNGATIRCPYDGVQPFIVRPQLADLRANIAWAMKLKSDYVQFAGDIARSDPQGASAVIGYRSAQAADFARAVAQNGRFDYQRPPAADMFLTFYTSFASYHFGMLGYYAGFSLQHLFEGGGSQNWLHAMWDRLAHRGRTRIDDTAASGLSQLNEWCIRRAFQDAGQNLIV
jgi:hypothetical protein